MLKKLPKWGLLALALGWLALVAELIPPTYQPEMLGVAVVNGLLLGIWAFR